MLAQKIAVRFLTANKLRSFFVMLGIAVGVSVQIFIGILIDSLQQSLLNQTIGDSPHVTISFQEDGQDRDWNTIKKGVEETSGISGVEVIAETNAFLSADDQNSPILLRGMNESSNGFYRFEEKMIEGSAEINGNGIIIGEDLRDDLNLSVGSSVILSYPQGQPTEFRVAGIFDYKIASLNKLWVITALSSAQQFMGIEDSISKIELQVSDVFSSNLVASDLNNRFSGDGIVINDWQSQNEQLLSALQSQSTSSLVIQIFVLASVIIAITSILTVTVIQKSRQIGILKAMGQTNRSSSAIFIWQGFYVGLGGILVGIPLGLILFLAFNTFATNPDGTPIVEAFIRWKFIGATGLIVLFSATFSGLIPARQSSKLNPIEIIRNG